MEKRKSIVLLSVLGLFSMGIVLYFSLFFYQNYRQELIEIEQKQLLTMARTVGKSLVNYMNQELESIDLYFSELDDGDCLDLRDIRQIAGGFMGKKKGLYDTIACYDSRRSLAFQEGVPEFDYGNIPDCEEAAICGKKLSKGGWYQLFISRRFRWKGESYTVVCALNLDQIYRQIVAPVQIGEGGYSIVKDKDLIIIMHHAASQIGIDAVYDRGVRYPQLDLGDLVEWTDMQQNQEEGCGVINSYVWDDPALAPERRIVAYTTIYISGEEWIVNSTLPYEELDQPLSRMVKRLMGMSALFLLFLVSFVYFVTRILMQAEAQKKEIAYLKEINQGMEMVRRKDEVLQRYERMQSIGQMSSHIAHEFNNYLTPVMIYGEILEEDDSITPQNQELIRGIMKSVEEAAALSRRLLDFSRQDSYGELMEQNLGEEVQKACRMIEQMAPENISVITEITEEPLWIQGNKGMMSHLLLNLSNNAFHAMEGKAGTLTVRLSRRGDFPEKDLEKEEIISWKDDPGRTGDGFSEGWAVLSISDTGCGISKEVLDKIFEPFYTTKRSGKGTGLGLSVVQNVMEAVNGRIEIESQVGVGTTFILSFPLRSPSGTKNEKQERKGFNRLIVVDDDRELLKALSAMLKESPIKAEYYDHPAAVLSLLQQGKDEVDMILTDYQMPSINGLELAAMVRRLNPQIHLVLMSGLDSGQFDWYLKNGMIDEFIPKTELAGRLMEMLEEQIEEEGS